MLEKSINNKPLQAKALKPKKSKLKQTKKVFSFILFQLLCVALLAPFLVFWGPFSTLKAVSVGTIYTSRHPQVLNLFLSKTQIASLLQKEETTINTSTVPVEQNKVVNTNGIQIIDISGHNYMGTFKGKVMLIKDPSRVGVAATSAIGNVGERVSEMAKRVNAIAAINAGGFDDPNGKGNGGFPQGLTIINNKVVFNDSGNSKQEIVGLDQQNKLIVGNYTLAQVQAMGMRDCISFYPALVQNGKGMITQGDGGWGIGPRTGIGQLSDGTIIFVVIDGRQPWYSVGASLVDLQQVFLKYGAVTAVNLDGGSSSTLYYNGAVINKPADIFGERYVPTAFVVKP